jgi:hypothetical protein
LLLFEIDEWKGVQNGPRIVFPSIVSFDRAGEMFASCLTTVDVERKKNNRQQYLNTTERMRHCRELDSTIAPTTTPQMLFPDRHQYCPAPSDSLHATGRKKNVPGRRWNNWFSVIRRDSCPRYPFSCVSELVWNLLLTFLYGTQYCSAHGAVALKSTQYCLVTTTGV